jgi:hypothetical protein
MAECCIRSHISKLACYVYASDEVSSRRLREDVQSVPSLALKCVGSMVGWYHGK